MTEPVEILVGGSVPHVTDSTPWPCGSCGGVTWLAPSSVALVLGRGLAVVCHDCAGQMVGPDDEVAITEAQYAELVEEIGAVEAMKIVARMGARRIP